MIENRRSYKMGEFKAVVGRVSEHDPLEVLLVRFFNKSFDWDLDNMVESHAEDVLREMYFVKESYEEALKEVLKTGTQVFEVVGDLHEESWKSWTDCGYEYDSNNWFENTKVKEITGNNLDFFKECQEPEWKNFIGLEVKNDEKTTG